MDWLDSHSQQLLDHASVFIPTPGARGKKKVRELSSCLCSVIVLASTLVQNIGRVGSADGGDLGIASRMLVQTYKARARMFRTTGTIDSSRDEVVAYVERAGVDLSKYELVW
jgi:hypothetical protein